LGNVDYTVPIGSGMPAYAPNINPSQLSYMSNNTLSPIDLMHNTGSSTSYQINIDASNMVDSSNMVRVVQQALIDINKGGYSQTPAGYGF
jgi:hypothetical protein